jgi:glycosyltransferase involved in cell wall biosynthesis
VHIAICGPATLSLLQPHLSKQLPTSGYPFPGTSALALKYRERGHQVTVVTSGHDIGSTVEAQGDNLKVIVVPSRGRARTMAFDFFKDERRHIENQIRLSRPDACHAHWTYEFALGAQRSGYPTLLTVHDWAPAVARRNKHPYWMFRAAMQARVLTGRGQLTAPSAYIAARVERWYERDCEVIPNGIELSAYRGADGSQQERRAGFTVGMMNVGWSGVKNVATALHAWHAVRSSVAGAELHLAGPGYEPSGEAESWARSAGLTDGVIFEGPIKPGDVPAWMANKDIFLHTSREESFGIVLIEAMASGIPVIAGATSGAVAEVTGGRAVLIDVNSPVQVAASIISLHADPVAMERLSREGVENSRRFELDATAAGFERVLSGL